MSEKTKLRDDSILAVPEHVLTRNAAGETVLLNLDNEQYYGLQGIGTRIYELLGQGTTFGVVVSTLSNEYDVDHDTLVSDLAAIVVELQARGLLVVDAA